MAKGASATTRQVAERAGVSEGLLFQRYGTKADLFFAALAPPVADPTAVLPIGADAVGDREALEDAALHILAYFREVMPILLPLVTHPAFDPERFFHHEAPASLQGWIGALVRFLDAQGSDGAAPINSRGAATLLTSSLFGVALIDTTGIHKDPMPETAIKAMVRALWEGIGN